MVAMDFYALAQECAPAVHPETMAAVVRVESGFNPYAIGVVNGRLQRQPKNLAEAVATATALEQGGWNYSVGIGQVNKYNLPKYGLSLQDAFEPCKNLAAGAEILKDCYQRAAASGIQAGQPALQAALSCYYSGNFARGLRPDAPGQPSYVQKVLANAGQAVNAIPVIPAPQKTGQQQPSNNPDAPVQLQAVKPAPAKPVRVPIRYDGFTPATEDPRKYNGYEPEAAPGSSS